MKNIMINIWNYKYFILSSIKTEFKTKVSRSKFGVLWVILHPLALVLIYALVLSQVMSAKLPGVQSSYSYPIYILSGIVGWTLFSEILARSITVFIDNGNLLKKISFPKLTLPLIVIGTSIINFILFFIIMFLVFALLGHLPIHGLFWLPLLVLLTIGFASGLGLFIGILNIFIRDIGQVMNIILQFWFWLTPIVYMPSIVPDKYHWLFVLNPMTNITIAYQDILLYDKAPNFSSLIYPLFLTLFFLALSMLLFTKAQEEMADVL